MLGETVPSYDGEPTRCKHIKLKHDTSKYCASLEFWHYRWNESYVNLFSINRYTITCQNRFGVETMAENCPPSYRFRIDFGMLWHVYRVQHLNLIWLPVSVGAMLHEWPRKKTLPITVMLKIKLVHLVIKYWVHFALLLPHTYWMFDTRVAIVR